MLTLEVVRGFAEAKTAAAHRAATVLRLLVRRELSQDKFFELRDGPNVGQAVF